MLHKYILLVDTETTSSINGSMTQKVVHCFDSPSTGKTHFLGHGMPLLLPQLSYPVASIQYKTLAGDTIGC